MKNKIFKTLIVITISCLNVFAQENFRNFQNKEYVKINNEWQVLNVSDLQHYAIETNVLSIKFKTNVSEQNIQNYIQQNNLTFLRKAITGWYDFQTNGVVDIFQKSTQLLDTSTSIVEKLEIPTKGSYNIIPNDTNQASQWHLTKINAYGAWNIETGKPNVKIAILDSGTNWVHEDLGLGTDNYQNIFLNSGEDAWTNPNNPATGNGIDDDGNGRIDDWKGWNFDLNTNNSRGIYYHGTWVAGIVSAKTNNNKGIAGISGGWNSQGSKLLICNVGQNSPNGAVIDDAILYAGQMGVKVVQLSLSVGQSTAIDDAITYAYNNYGVTIVCAAGNDYFDGGVSYPASHPLVLSVGASNQLDNMADFSNYGDNLFVSAPGVDIISTGLSGTYNCTPLPDCNDGTSFAAPIVSGIIALMYSVNPCLTQAQVKQILKDTSEKVGGYNYNWNSSDLGHSRELGYGRVNAFLAVQIAHSMGLSTLDLMVKDGVDDIGNEPNNITPYMWASTDIWIRNQPDGIDSHQNPEYSTTIPNYAYVRVTNKSCVSSTGNEQLTLYWAKAGTSLEWPDTWDGNHFFPSPNDTKKLGAPVATVTIPVLQANQQTVLQIPFIVPNPADYAFAGADQWHFCLLARIEAVNDPSDETTNLYTNVQNNNNIAWKNVTIVDLVANKTSGTIAVGNPFDEPRTFILELVKENLETGKPIYDEAEVTIKMDNTLFNAWERGGKLAQEVNETVDEKLKVVKGNNVLLNNIVFNANEMGTLTLNFNFLTTELTEKSKFVYHVIQKDAVTREIIGGETYVIKKQTRPIFIADAGGVKNVDKNEPITISASQISEPALYNWYDKDGNLIFIGKDLTVATEVATKYKLEVIATADGFKDYSEVEVNLKPSVLGVITPNPATNNVTVSYKLNEVGSAYLMIIGGYGTTGTSNNYILDVNNSETNINISNYQNGFYTVALVCNGQIVDAKTLIKQ